MDLKTLLNEVSLLENLIKEKAFEKELLALEKTALADDFWANQSQAQKVSKRKKKLEEILQLFFNLKESANNYEEIAAVFSEEEKEKEFAKLCNMKEDLDQLLFFTNEYDDANAILIFSVGAGGTDASDWTEMCVNMYLKYAESKDWKVEVLDKQVAEIAGLKGATLRVYGGTNVYAYLKNEVGLHRMVRKSPFNSGNTRETSFCHLDVVPEIEQSTDLEINDKDLKIDTFRAQGAGGQHVNTTDSAVRITHLKTGLSVQCQNERSQLQNKNQAMLVLKSKLLEMQRQENLAKQKELKSEVVSASFGGGRTRSYVLDDRYVKDERTGLKTSQVEKVLGGDLDQFILAALKNCPKSL
jgi:peptide chain release factor 2